MHHDMPMKSTKKNDMMLIYHLVMSEDQPVSYYFLVKDKLHHIGGATNFCITKEVLTSCSQAHSKYVADLAKKKEEERERTERAKKDEERIENSKAVALQISDLDRLIRFSDVMLGISDLPERDIRC